jgi:uncharacterized protein YjbI with pentapeptide repeats
MEAGLSPDAVAPLPGTAATAVAWRSKSQLNVTVVAKATFAFAHDAEMPRVEPQEILRAEVHHRKNPAMSVRFTTDLAPHLGRADVLFTGSAYAPPGATVQLMKARLVVVNELGRALLDKSLLVRDDAGFQQMPIVYERAFGGFNHLENPLGVGSVANSGEPSIVDPTHPRRTAGFGPLGRSWPMRKQLLGTAPRRALEAPIAQIPDGFDWSYFQAAPPDQRIDFLRGDEWILLEGLHPAHVRTRMRLPGARALARIHGLSLSGVAEGQEVELVADTLRIDGDQQRCTVVWRRSFPVAAGSTLAAVRVVANVESHGVVSAWPSASALWRREGEPQPRSILAEKTVPFRYDTALLEPTPTAPATGEDGTTVLLSSEAEQALEKRPATPFRAGSAPDDIARGPGHGATAPALQTGTLDLSPEDEPRREPAAETLAVPPQDDEPAAERPPSLPFVTASHPPPSAPPSRPGPPGESAPTGTLLLSSDEQTHAGEHPPVPFGATPSPSRPAAPGTAARSSRPPTPAAQFFHQRQQPLGAQTLPGAPFENVPHRRAEAIPVITRTPFIAFTLPWQLRPPREARAVVVKGTCALVPGGPAKLRADTDLPSGDVHLGDDLQHTSLLYPSDFAVFKPRADVTLKGHAFAPKGSALVMEVRFQFGRAGRGFDRRIAVFGDRRWEKTVVKLAPSRPDRFRKVPLIYELAFGGPGFEKNPVGRGYDGAKSAARSGMLPNLEDPFHVIERPGDTPEPACFGAVPALWQARWSKLGTYDARWLETRWPYFPEDVDWSHFQCAPPAQQLDAIRGDEPFAITGMHPDLPVIEGTLPRLRPRCFAQKTTEAGGGFQEIALRLDTAAFDVDEMKLNLLWRGLVEVQDDDASDIADLFVIEQDDSAPPLDIVEVYERYRAEKLPLAPAASAPEAASAPANDAAAGPLPAASATERRLRERLSGAGLATAAALAAAAAPAAAAAAPPPGAGTPADPRQVRGQVEARLAAKAPLDGLDLAGAALSDLDFTGSSLAQANLKEASLRRCRFAGADLSGAQLSGADLSGATLDGANLERADLTGADLSDASAVGARVAQADFSRARGERASFREARGGGARFAEGIWKQARFERADLPGADLTRTELDGAVFDGALLPEVMLYDARATRASFQRANLSEARADGVCLLQCSLQGLSAPSSVWDRAVLDDSSFLGATLVQASFARASCARAVFSGADLSEGRLGRAKLTGATLLKANLMRASLESADLTDADLRGANLHGAETWKAKLRGAQIDLAIVTQSKLKDRQ